MRTQVRAPGDAGAQVAGRLHGIRSELRGGSLTFPGLLTHSEALDRGMSFDFWSLPEEATATRLLNRWVEENHFFPWSQSFPGCMRKAELPIHVPQMSGSDVTSLPLPWLLTAWAAQPSLPPGGR